MSRDCAFCGRLFGTRTEAAAHERRHTHTDPACRWPGKPASMAAMAPVIHRPKETDP
jgi:hypothetical protein